MTYAGYFKPENTPQNQPLPGREMVATASGGYAFAADRWTRLNRFLLIGTEGGTFYEGERDLTLDNALAVMECITEDGVRVVNEALRVSDEGKAVKNSPAIFVLALCASKGDDATRRAAFDAMPKVCRTGTHLFEFVDAVLTFRGWGRGLRQAIGRWYNDQSLHNLALQLVKYRNRNGWTHKDLLRQAHVKPNPDRVDLLGWAADKVSGWASDEAEGKRVVLNAPLVTGFEIAKRAQSEDSLIDTIRAYQLPREAIPTQFLNSKRVWEMLLEDMPIMAMIRNLGKMSSLGLFEPFSTNTNHVVNQLTNRERIRKARIHPLFIFNALKTYESGCGMRGENQWKVNGQIVRALEHAFELSFDNVERIDKNILIALDCSSSMSWSAGAVGVPVMPVQAAAALAWVYRRTQPNVHVIAFSTKTYEISNAHSSLSELTTTLKRLSGGGTDCSLPFKYAYHYNLPVDGILMVTDGESWAGHIHTSVALQRLRLERQVRLVEVRTTANGHYLREPEDKESMEMAGFSPDTMTVAQMFFNGTI